ncbi:hypothetical protein HBH98_157640 [Parastagonospora nodorum]|nr:hypothetical protein HBH53_031570 [Parastagonospora nodorum]KAH3969328.1 hypothetical protein HBH51_123730 [Parastagonospora nodorum]KAH3990776.1 hypothetical protein HBH52_008560 [Parastagonospora nodorum]KAH4006581.1 hypothetical protein HBI10_018990 [Parastagonospora nodorum]KAH4015344.1 hypothetical protein HBI13_161650 [Parastagonospora nodorum]
MLERKKKNSGLCACAAKKNLVWLMCRKRSGEGERLVVGIMHVNFHAGGML